MFELPEGVSFRQLQCLLEIPADILDTGGLTQPDAVLEVEEQAAVVQVDGAYCGEPTVHDEIFGVDEANSQM